MRIEHYQLPNILRSSGIGIVMGLIPGTGGDTASWFVYNEVKRFAKDKSGFGKGEIAGVAVPEAANNAVVGGALIPTIALGIPRNSSTAILLGALRIPADRGHGSQLRRRDLPPLVS